MKNLSIVALGLAALAALVPAANAGIIVTSNVGLNDNQSVGTDPASLPGFHQITLSESGGFGPGNLIEIDISMKQSYSPLTGPTGAITSALGDTSATSITNATGSAQTVTMTITYESYNFPTTNPLTWISTIGATRLGGGATFTSSEVVKSGVDPNTNTPYFNTDATINHTTLTTSVGPSSTQTITTVLSPDRPFEIIQTLTFVLPIDASITVEKSDTLLAPEPASLIVWSLGAFGFGVVRLRRRKNAQKIDA